MLSPGPLKLEFVYGFGSKDFLKMALAYSGYKLLTLAPTKKVVASWPVLRNLDKNNLFIVLHII